MASFKFKVDSALLRELGERLVGKPHIALAELIKNSFDADALQAVVRITDDSIEVVDNGHGMTSKEFDSFWMRIGSPHKDRERLSRGLRRPLTGSKGVGRLAGQFLAKEMEIVTVSAENPDREFVGKVNWEEASTAGDLTEATVEYETRKRRTVFPNGAHHGTRVLLSGLNQQWDAKAIRLLAREIWWLQPPFRRNPRLKSEKQRSFEVQLEAADTKLARGFVEQMEAFLHLHYARITGELREVRKDGTGIVDLSIEWDDGDKVHHRYEIGDCRLHLVNFEVRVYHLKHRQKHGVRIKEAQEYLNEYGNVHIYDAGFHLPYYGADVDWLRTEQDHAHRLSRSRLLPENLQVPGGMEYLPTQSRLLGVVNVDTGFERQEGADESGVRAKDYLKIQITRDRLVENKAFEDLYHIVRWALDFYATRETLRVYEDKKATEKTEPARDKLERIEQALEKVEEQLEPATYKLLRKEVRDATLAADEETNARIRESNLLGTLATAGISALSFQHELNKQFRLLESHIDELEAFKGTSARDADRLHEIGRGLRKWLADVLATRSLFLNLSEAENRETKRRFRAKQVVESIRDQIALLLHGIPINAEKIEADIRLPEATFAEWSAIFQNVFLNAVNAMLDSDERRVEVSTQKVAKTRSILVQDTGRGVDLEAADQLFEPFVRKTNISNERKALGYGGMGLGLTIVRMLAGNLGCKVSFVKPSQGFSTAFRLSWSESHE